MITEFRFKDRTITIVSETIANAFLAALCARLVARGGWWSVIPTERTEDRTRIETVRIFNFADEYA